MLPPDLLPGAEPFLAAFWELSTDRQIGFGGVGPIPAASIDRWVVMLELDDEDAELFRLSVRAMDAEFLEHANRTTGASPKKASSGTSRKQLTPKMFDAMFPGKRRTSPATELADKAAIRAKVVKRRP